MRERIDRASNVIDWAMAEIEKLIEADAPRETKAYYARYLTGVISGMIELITFLSEDEGRA